MHRHAYGTLHTHPHSHMHFYGFSSHVCKMDIKYLPCIAVRIKQNEIGH